jgi:hypothetical protein
VTAADPKKQKKKRGKKIKKKQKKRTNEETLFFFFFFLLLGRRFSLHGYHVVWNVSPIYITFGVLCCLPLVRRFHLLLFLFLSYPTTTTIFPPAVRAFFPFFFV